MRSQRYARRVESFKISNKVQVRWPIESLSQVSKISLKDNRTKEQWVKGIRDRKYKVIMIIRIIQYTKFGVPAAKMTLILKIWLKKGGKTTRTESVWWGAQKITHHHKNHKLMGLPWYACAKKESKLFSTTKYIQLVNDGHTIYHPNIDPRNMNLIWTFGIPAKIHPDDGLSI